MNEFQCIERTTGRICKARVVTRGRYRNQFRDELVADDGDYLVTDDKEMWLVTALAFEAFYDRGI